MNKSIKLIVNYFLGPLLFVILLYTIYNQIINQPDLSQRWEQIKISWKRPFFWIAFIMLFINWGVESLKWKKLISPLERFSFLQAFKAIMAGCSITMLLPNRMGEYGGRIMYVKDQNKIKAISLTIIGSISQLAITVLLGTIALVFLKYTVLSSNQIVSLSWMLSDAMLVIALGALVFLLLLYFNTGLIVPYLSKIKRIEKFVKHFSVVDLIPRKQLLRIFFLSFLRYMIFTLQYVLLLHVMEVAIPMALCFWLVGIFYLMLAIIPTIGFTELPIRATVISLLLGLFSNNLIGIQAATFTIWVINLVIPAMIGSFFILRIKMIKER